MEGGAAGPSNRGPFEYSNDAYASNTEVKLLSHLLIYHAYSTDTKNSLITAARMVIDDSQDYSTSPVEQGPWTLPISWRRRGSPLDLFCDFLEAATTLKAGYLAPVELIAPAHLGIHLTAKCIVNYRSRLLAPKDSKKPKPSSSPPLTRSKRWVGGWVGGWGYNIWMGVQHNMWVGVKKCWGGGGKTM